MLKPCEAVVRAANLCREAVLSTASCHNLAQFGHKNLIFACLSVVFSILLKYELTQVQVVKSPHVPLSTTSCYRPGTNITFLRSHDCVSNLPIGESNVNNFRNNISQNFQKDDVKAGMKFLKLKSVCDNCSRH